jgi:hypothetical protein
MAQAGLPSGDAMAAVLGAVDGVVTALLRVQG